MPEMPESLRKVPESLRKAPESLRTLWRTGTPVKRALIVGVPVAVIALVAAGGAYAAFSSDSGAAASVVAPTQAPATRTPVPPSPSPSPEPSPTEPPVHAGLQDSAPPSGAVANNAPRYQAPAGGTGPGAAIGTSWSLTIPSIGVNASIYSRTIGTNGQMGNPTGAWDVIWYDFAANGWAGMGGQPGEPGANVVLAGHVDYIHVGPAVFWSIRNLQPGDIVTVNTPGGPISYAVQWGQWAGPDQDFTPFVSKTGQDSVTLVTCIGTFSGGHYSNRYVVRGVRV